MEYYGSKHPKYDFYIYSRNTDHTTTNYSNNNSTTNIFIAIFLYTHSNSIYIYIYYSNIYYLYMDIYIYIYQLSQHYYDPCHNIHATSYSGGDLSQPGP